MADSENVISKTLIDLFADDSSLARRVLDGAPIVIMPVGAFHRRGSVQDVTREMIVQFADNFAQRETRGIRRSRVAVDEGHEGGAVGWYKEIAATEAGLTATFDWTNKGRSILEAGQYAYFSATVYWEQTDRETGEAVTNQIAGGALTNYPFFGNDTALYSEQEFAATKSEGGVQYPQRAYLVSENSEQVSTWHLRVYTFENGALKLDSVLMGLARSMLTSPNGYQGNRYEGPHKEAATARLRALFEQEGLEFNNIIGGNGMNEDKEKENGSITLEGGAGPLVFTAEKFAALQASVEATTATMATMQASMTAERETYAAEVTNLKTALSLVEEARAAEQFSVIAEGFNHLPVETSPLAQHLRWLHGQDNEENQPHAAFFMALLRKVDGSLSSAFAAFGSDRGLPVGSAEEQLNRLVTEYQAKNPTVDYSEALTSVAGLHPALYAEYSAEVI